MCPANKKRSPLRWPFLLAFGEVDENSRGVHRQSMGGSSSKYGAESKNYKKVS